MRKILSNKEFYNQLASDYDSMISFDSALQRKKKNLVKFIKPGMKLAADLGCGSGLDSIAMASLGLRVVAFDPSSGMIKAARENARREKSHINFLRAPVDLISERFDDKFDLVVSLGNSFANVERKKFHDSLRKCFDILKPGGILLIQVLNYWKVLKKKLRIVNINSAQNNYFIRFYDFIDDGLIFNILSFRKEMPSEYKFISAKLFPYTRVDFDSGLKIAGFGKIRFFSDFNLSVYDKSNSNDLIIKAIKG